MSEILSYELDEEVFVTPFHFVGDVTYDCRETSGKIVYKQGVKAGALYTVFLHVDSTHGWHAGDTVRVKHFQLRKLTKVNDKAKLDEPGITNGVSADEVPLEHCVR